MQKIPKSILKDAANGNIAAFEHIYRIAGGFVYSIALHMTHNNEDAQEVTQDVFLKIFKKLKGFYFRAAFKTWVYRMTVNAALDICRKHSQLSRKAREFEKMLKIKNLSEEVHGIIDKREAHEHLEYWLDLLNPDQRVVIVLRDIEGLSYKEIARALRINRNTVRNRLRRARLTLYAVGRKEVILDEVR